MAANARDRASRAFPLVRTELIFVCALAAASAHAADWKKTLSPRAPGPFPTPASFDARYQFGWMGIAAGEGQFQFQPANPDEVALEMQAKSSGFARTLFRLDATHAATADRRTLRPKDVRQTEKYKSETVTTELRFDEKGVTRVRQKQPSDSKPAKPKRFKFAEAFDLHTALLWVRSQPLRARDHYRLVVFPGNSPYLANVKVAGREPVEVAGRNYRAVRLELQLQRIDRKSLKLASYSKVKRAVAWISDDEDRVYLKAEADIFAGSVWMELQSVSFNDS